VQEVLTFHNREFAEKPRENDYKRMTDFEALIFTDGCVKHFPPAEHLG
jgi:hypothetical protein